MNQGEANARAFERPAPLVLDTMETLEQMRQLFRGNANAGVADDQLRACAIAGVIYANGDRPFESELEGVGQKIEDNLLPHISIDKHLAGEVLALDVETDPGALGRRTEIGGQIGRQGPNVRPPEVRLHAAGFYAGKIKK